MDKKFCSVELEYIKSDLNDRDNTMKLLMKKEKKRKGKLLYFMQRNSMIK